MKISVLQWNVWYKEDIRNIANFLKENPADIVCLQELTINSDDQVIKNSPEFIANELGYEFHIKELPIESTDGTSLILANGIFSRFPITNKSYSWINEPKSSGGYDDEYRAYVEIDLQIGDRTLSVGTTHMSYTHEFQSTTNKKIETDKLIAAIGKSKKPYIFTGDLNAIPESYTVSSLRQILTDAGPDISQKSWTTKPFSYNGFEETDLNWRLDYAFVSNELSVNSSSLLLTDISDHLPLRVEIDF